LERIDCCMRYDMSFTHESHVQARGDILASTQWLSLLIIWKIQHP
jgi:hypothetical protein